MLVSVCIPCYRSAKTLPTVVENICAAFAQHPEYDYEILLANDGSPDNTFEVIRQICEANPKVRGFDLTRNYGQNQALCALYDNIQGDAAIFMDDDGQHPTEGIFLLLEEIKKGNDVALAKFPHKHHSLFKRATSWLHRAVAEWVGTCPKGIVYSSFMAWSKTSIDAVKDYHSPFPSVGAYLMTVTSRFVNVELPHLDRMEGSSGYTLRKLLTLTLTSLTSFSIIPLRIAAFIGTCFAGFGFIWGIIAVIRKLIFPEIAAGYTSTLVLLLIIGGILMIILGIMGEYIGRIYMILSGKPQYRIREEVCSETSAQ